MQSAGPIVVAFVAERGSDMMALLLVGGVAITVLICLLSIRREQRDVAADAGSRAARPARWANALSVLSRSGRNGLQRLRRQYHDAATLKLDQLLLFPRS